MDGQWYSYDDSSVDLIPEEEVCTRGAYILFYERRNAIPPWSASCSVRGKAWIFDTLLFPGLSYLENSAVLSANCSFSRCWIQVLTLQYLPVVWCLIWGWWILLFLVGSTSSSVSDHWLIRLTGDSKRGSVVSRSSITFPSSTADSPDSPVFMDDGPIEERGTEPYSAPLYLSVKTKCFPFGFRRVWEPAIYQGSSRS